MINHIRFSKDEEYTSPFIDDNEPTVEELSKMSINALIDIIGKIKVSNDVIFDVITIKHMSESQKEKKAREDLMKEFRTALNNKDQEIRELKAMLSQ